MEKLRTRRGPFLQDRRVRIRPDSNPFRFEFNRETSDCGPPNSVSGLMFQHARYRDQFLRGRNAIESAFGEGIRRIRGDPHSTILGISARGSLGRNSACTCMDHHSTWHDCSPNMLGRDSADCWSRLVLSAPCGRRPKSPTLHIPYFRTRYYPHVPRMSQKRHAEREALAVALLERVSVDNFR